MPMAPGKPIIFQTAAVDRIGEIPFHGVLQHNVEECARRHLRELGLSGLDQLTTARNGWDSGVLS